MILFMRINGGSTYLLQPMSWLPSSIDMPAFHLLEFHPKPYNALFSSTQKTKIFQNSPSHRIFRRTYGVLNIDENKN